MSLSKLFTKKPNLIEGKFRTLLVVSLFGWLILLVGQVIDNILAGNILGEAGLSAVQIVAPFLTVISAIASFAGMGFAVKFSHLKGAGKDDDANKIVGLGILFTVAISIVMALLMFFLKEQLLSLFNMSPQVKEYAYQYYDWYIGIAIAQPFYVLIFKIVGQDGDPLWTVLSSISQVVVNFVLSIILINIMGIKGLSLGSFISIVVSLIILCFHFLSKSNSIKIRFTLDLRKLKDPAMFGFPALLGNLSLAIVNICLNAYIAKFFGDTYLASFTLVCFVVNLKLLFSCISDNLSAFLSTAKGSNNNEEIKLCFKLLKKYCTIVSIIASVLVMSLCMVLPMMFKIVPSSPQYVYSYSACLIIAPVFICFAFTMNLGNAYTAIGKPKVTIINQIIANLITPILFPILFAFLMDSFFGIIIGYATSAAISIAIMAISLAIIHKPHRVFVVEENDEKQFAVDVFLVEEDIKLKREEIVSNLTTYEIEEVTKEKVLGLYDETCQIVHRNNPNKLVTCRFTYCVKDNQIRILQKNNGRILSIEEKQNELNRKEEHETVNLFYDLNAISLTTMISFNSQVIIVNRS